VCAEPTHRFESSEQVLETVRQQRDLPGADQSGLALSGIQLTGLDVAMILVRKRRRAQTRLLWSDHGSEGRSRTNGAK
jgi:hypothetical protein